MPRQLSTRVAVSQFLSLYLSAYELARIAEIDSDLAEWESTIDAHAYHPRQSRKIVALAFMNMISAWEEFLESVFIRYLAGAKSQGGYSPELRLGSCDSIEHAYAVFSGRNHYNSGNDHLSWSNYPSVISKAKIFFKDGRPFSDIPPLDQQRLADAIVIRNRIAHASKKCRVQFKRVALDHIRPPSDKLPRGFDPGSLLVTECTIPFTTICNPNSAYFYAYADLLGTCVSTISPP